MTVHVSVTVCLQWSRILKEFLCGELIAYCIILITITVITELDLSLSITTDIQSTLLITSTS